MKRGVLVAAGIALAMRRAIKQSRRWDLAGRTVLVTGGSRGLGLVLARQLMQAGALVAVCARDADTLERARAELSQQGRVLALTCDVTRESEVERLVGQVSAQLGPIDALINNAGAIAVGPVDTMDVADFDDAMDTHFWGPLYATLAVLPDMRRRRRGRIVNVTSIGGKISVPHLVPYSASKFALVGLSEGLRAELARDGIQVSTVCPGLMRTGSPRHAQFKGRHRAEYAWFSITDSLPGLSIPAESAAAAIVEVLRSGQAERVLSVPARLAALMKALCPGTTAEVLALVNRLLPASGGRRRIAAKGTASTSAFSPSFLTRLGEQAALQHNQTAERRHPDSLPI